MAESVIQMSKQANKIDGSLKQKAYTFLEKLAEDDTVPGLHVEPIKGAADARVRTGRVDDQYRAVMFKVMNENTRVYVIHGIYNHDEANKLAENLTMTVNPINGLPDFNHGAPVAHQFAEPESWELSQPGVQEPLPLIAFSAEDLTVGLGIPPDTAATAVAMTSEGVFNTWAETLPQWQGLALSCLASGEPITTVAQELELLHQPVDARDAGTAFEESSPATDDEIITGFDRPASKMEFARIDGAEELRRIILDGDFGAWRVFLHPQQRKWVERNWNGPFRLAGGAGTGKTVVAIHRARRLALDDPAACVVLTTFTTNLAQELVSSLKKLDPDVPLASELGQPGIHVKSIDALANGVLKDASDVSDAVADVLGVGRTDIGRRTRTDIAWNTAITAAGTDLDERLRKAAFLQSEYEMIVLPNNVTEVGDYLTVRRAGRGVALSRRQRKAVWAVIESYRASARQAGQIDFAETAAIAAAHLRIAGEHPAQHVLVDEGQDFTPCHWKLIRELVADGADDIFIAEDAHQRIYGQRLVLSNYDIHTRGRSQRLRLNYRTTAQNLAWAEQVLAGEEYLDSDGNPDAADSYPSARSGPEPEVRSFETLTDELKHAAELLQRWLDAGLAPETCAILVRDRATRERVVTGLSERGVMTRSLDSGAVPAGKPVVLTMHRAKGTEFARVLLFGLNKDSVPMGLEAYEYDPLELAAAMLRERSLIYVAASRARDELVVSYSGAPSALLSNCTKPLPKDKGLAASASSGAATPASAEDEDAVDGSPESEVSQGLRPWLPSDAPPVAVDLPARVTESSGMPTDDLDADEWIDWFQLLSEEYRSENRDRLMVEGLRAGLILQAVGDLYDLSRERVRQIAGQQGVTMSVLRRQQREQRDRRWRRVARHIVGVSLSHPELTIAELAEWAETDEATVKKALRHRVAVHQSSINSWSVPRTSDAELLDALREWAAQTATHTGDDYTNWAQAKGLPGRQTVQMRFGGWNLALQEAGLDEHVRDRGGLRPVISNPEMWASVMQFFKEDLPSYSFNAYEDYAAKRGLVSGAAVRIRLGSWSAIKDRVRDLMRYAAYGDGSWEWGEEVLAVVPGGASRNFVTREQAVDAIRRVAEGIEGPITVVAYERARSEEYPHANVVQDRCGSWTNAVAEAGLTDRLSAKGFNRWSTGAYRAP